MKKLFGMMLLAASSTLAFPLGIDAALSNSVGIGTFIPGYRQVPDYSTTLSLSPHYSLPQFWSMPQITMSAGMDIGIAWLDSSQTAVSDGVRSPRVSDVSLTFAMPKAVNIESWGLSFSPRVGAVFPASKTSQALNRVLGLSVGGTVKWAKSDFSISWSPGFTGFLHSGPAKTVNCNTAQPPMINPHDPDFSLDAYVSSIVNDGNCDVSGRQTIGTLKNVLNFSYAPSRHNLTVGLEWRVSFLRPLVDNPDLRSIYASNQSFTETVLGRIEYGYTFPVGFDFGIAGGIMSYQGSYTKDGNISFHSLIL